MILFHAKRDGTVTTTPNFVPQGSSMQDLVVVSDFAYDYCAIKLYPASGEYIEDVPCTPILQKDFSTIFTAALPPKATVVAGSVDYQLVFTAADGTIQTTLAGSFTVPRGVPVSTPGSVEELAVKTIGDIYTIMANTYGLFVGHEGNIYKNTEDIAALKKTIASAGYVTIPVTEWEDSSPTIATFTLDGFGAGMTAVLIPADSTTQTIARDARLNAHPSTVQVDGDTQRVNIIRANADKAPVMPLRFAYMILKTTDTSVAPTVAILGVDSYGEGNGAASGVDEEAVKALIGKEVPEWARSKTKPTYTPEEVKARPDTWMPTAKEVGADPADTAERKTTALRQEVNNSLDECLKSADLPAKLDEYRATKGLIDKTVSDLVNYYNKSQTLTKDEINALVSAIPKFDIEVVTYLPTSNISDTTVYLVKSGADSSNLYTEYIRANGAWEKLGTQTVDLTGYATEAWVNGLIAAYVKTADMEAYVAGLLKSYITKEEADKTYQPSGNYLTPTTGDQRYAKPSDIPTVPSALPNPYALTILGKTYTGGKAVSLTAEELMDAIKIASGGIVSYLDGNKIVMSGNLPDATYTAYYEVNGELVEIGDLTLGAVTPDPVTYTIRWVNYDGTVLEIDEKVPEGVTPTYDGATPTRAADDQYTYTFKDWDKTVVAATADATYTATYTQTAKPTEPAYDNLLTAAGYETGKKVSTSTGEVTTADGCVSGFIPVPSGLATIRIKNITFSQTGNINNIVFYSAATASAKVGFWVGQTGGFNNQVTDNNGVYTFGVNESNVKYFRFSCAVISDDTIVTINQEIK